MACLNNLISCLLFLYVIEVPKQANIGLKKGKVNLRLRVGLSSSEFHIETRYIPEEQIKESSCVDFLANLCRSCLVDLGSQDLKEWCRLYSNAIDNLAFVSVYFYIQMEQKKQLSKEDCMSSDKHVNKLQ